MLSSVHSLLGDTPPAMVRSAADMILGYLKDDTLKDLDKKREVDSLLSTTVPNETFAQLVSLGKKITDYGDDSAEAQKGEDGEGEGEGAIDDDVGVAVVFEEEDEEDDEEEQFEMRDSDDSDEEDEEEEERLAGAAGTRDGDDDPMVTGEDDGQDGDGDAVMLGSTSAATKSTTTKSTSSDGSVPAREIDGFWLQRLFAASYPDPLEAAQKTESAMSLLEGDSSVRDVENALMDLTEYDKFELVATLVKNREKVVWCTRLTRSDEDGKVDVEVAMREKGCGWILKELRGEKSFGASSSIIKPSATSSAEAKKGTLAPGSLAPAPRKTVDLDSMAFQQGARLMSNKKVKLPEGSFKRSKKGYEEVHVPAPKPAPLKEGELVPVTDLPEWARDAFKGNPTLNRVQSRLYPVAFGTDEPLLLCAPTGAGKVRLFSLTLFFTFSY
jgi:pre-mRNA-splicing helicase BRR2